MGQQMNKTIIVDAAQETSCPKCSHTFALSDGISRQTIERFAEMFEEQFAERRKVLEAQLEAEARKRAEREAAQQLTVLKDQLAAANAVAEESKSAIEKVRQEATAKARDQLATEMKALQEALVAKDGSLSDLRNGELNLRRQLREAEEKSQSQELEYQRKLDEERRGIEDRARACASEEFNRKESQWKAQIESAQREAADLKRKLEQGSQQTQGEAAELGLETMLRGAFPLDEFVPVPKGTSGADLMQRVRSPSGQVCGTIIWEIKQTRNWSSAWVPKLKHDQQEVGAEIAVLVTAAMPQDSREPFVREADVWVARPEAARPLADALRTTLLELQKLRQANTGRNEKMELVYNYICSPQFAQRVKAIVDGFSTMQAELESEKTAMMRIWKKRETQLTRLSGGILGVVGELQGFGQEMLPRLDGLVALEAVGAVLEGELQ
jgi:hypothetical protein